MNDSETLDTLREKHERNRERRIQAVKRWAEYIQETPIETWGPQQNVLVNAQLESARTAGLGADHFRRISRSHRRPSPTRSEEP